MGFLANLWIPILLSAVFVFIVSSLIHMVFRYHKNDYEKLPSEEGVADALRKFNIPPGDYLLPYCNSMKDMKSPEFMEKINKGPVALMTVIKSGNQGMAKNMILWFLYSIVVSIFAAYICDRAVVGVPVDYLKVFRFVGCSAFMGYSFALCQYSIWFSRKWSSTLLSMFDGLLYALVTAGVFGWLWPR